MKGKMGVWFVVTAGLTDRTETHEFMDNPNNPPDDAVIDTILRGLLDGLREPLRDFLHNRKETHVNRDIVLIVGDEDAIRRQVSLPPSR
jgi:hypothetical protein